MRTPLGAFIIVAIMLLLDWYVLMALKTVSNGLYLLFTVQFLY